MKKFFFTVRVAKHLNRCQERFWNLLERVKTQPDKVLSNLNLLLEGSWTR